MLKNDRYIGGGKLFFTAVGGSEVEIGEIQEASLTFSVTTKDAISKDNVMQKKVAKVATAIDARLKFVTQITNAHNTAMAMMGEEKTESFEIGDTLPDGSTAAEAVSIPYIDAATKPIIEGQFKFVGDEDGDTKPVLVVFNASLTPTGDIGYIIEDFSKLSFEGEVLETNEGYAKEYRMSVGA